MKVWKILITLFGVFVFRNNSDVLSQLSLSPADPTASIIIDNDIDVITPMDTSESVAPETLTDSTATESIIITTGLPPLETTTDIVTGDYFNSMGSSESEAPLTGSTGSSTITTGSTGSYYVVTSSPLETTTSTAVITTMTTAMSTIRSTTSWADEYSSTEHKLNGTDIIQGDGHTTISGVICLDSNYTVLQPSCLNTPSDIFCERDIEYFRSSCEYFVGSDTGFNNFTNYCAYGYFHYNQSEMHSQCIKVQLIPDAQFDYSNQTCYTTEKFTGYCHNAIVASNLIYLSLNAGMLSSTTNLSNDIWMYSYALNRASKDTTWIHLTNFNASCMQPDGAGLNYVNFNCDILPTICFGDSSILTQDGCPSDQFRDVLYNGDTYNYCYYLEFSESQNFSSLQTIPYPATLTNLMIYQRLAIISLLKDFDRCHVDLTNLEVSALTSNSIITLNADGHIFLNGEYNCIVQSSIRILTVIPEFSFDYSPETNKLSIILYNGEHIPWQNGIPIVCYGSIDIYEPLPYPITFVKSVLTGNKTMTLFEFTALTPFPTNYRCYSKSYYQGYKIYGYENFIFPASPYHYYVVVLKSANLPNIQSLIDSVLLNYNYRTLDSLSGGETMLQVLLIENSKKLKKSNDLNMYDDYLFMEGELRGFSNLNISVDSIRNAKYCLAELLPKSEKFNFRSVSVGELSPSDENCLNGNTLPYTRRCKTTDMHSGADWESFDEEEKFCTARSSLSATTIQLFDLERQLLSNNMTKPVGFVNLIILIEENRKDITPIDLIQIAKIVNLLEVENEVWRDQPSFSALFVNMMNTISTIDRAVFVEAAQAGLNTTNILLDALDKVANWQPAEYDDNGLSIIRKSNLIVCSIDPSITNVTGIALYRNPRKVSHHSPYDLDNYFIENLYMHQSLDELLRDESSRKQLQIASYVPEKAYNYFIESSIPHNQKKLRVVITVFSNDKLFQTLQSNFADKVISLSVPGSEKYFPHFIPTIYKKKFERNSLDFCGFFNYGQPFAEKSLGEWNEKGCILIDSDVESHLTVCGCFHLTHFTYLLMGGNLKHAVNEDYNSYMMHNVVLEWITRICCGLSLIGIFFIILTSMTFQDWSADMKNIIILQFSLAIALQIILLSIADGMREKEKTVSECVALGACLQYIILVTFFWMLIIAVRQYQRFVKVFNSHLTKKFTIASMCFGWGLPLVPTIITATAFPDLYQEVDVDDICYPKETALYFGLMMPIAIVVAINLIIFLIVMLNICRNVNLRKSVQSYEFAQLRVSLVLFFLLGLTWLFGFLATFESTMRMAFSYIFNITAPLQGFIIFIYYIILNPNTRKLWLKKIRSIHS